MNIKCKSCHILVQPDRQGNCPRCKGALLYVVPKDREPFAPPTDAPAIEATINPDGQTTNIEFPETWDNQSVPWDEVGTSTEDTEPAPVPDEPDTSQTVCDNMES